MESTISRGIPVNLFIQPTDFEFIVRILQAFRQKKMLEFSLPKPEEMLASPMQEGAPLTQVELLRMVEEAEQEEKVSYEGFKTMFSL